MTRKITIGLPIYNGEKFLRKRIENIQSQTLNDFELIISDNNSTDDTHKICKEFLENKNNIKYFLQEKNQGAMWNFQFVLEKANTPYFVWAGADDIWDKDFLQENTNFLENEKKCVGCISEVETYGNSNNRELSNSFFANIVKKIKIGKYGPHEALGTYEEKVGLYLNANSAQAIYGIFRTDALKKSYVNKSFLAVDLAIILNILKYGDFHVIQKKLIRFYRGGFSSKGIISSTKKLKHNIIGRIFPYYPFTKWCFQNIGKKIFFKNIFHFFKLNLIGEMAIIYDVVLSKK